MKNKSRHVETLRGAMRHALKVYTQTAISNETGVSQSTISWFVRKGSDVGLDFDTARRLELFLERYKCFYVSAHTKTR